MNRNRQHSICKEQSGKTFSCPKANKTFAVKKNVDNKIWKNISTCTKQDEKHTIPSSVKEIKANALNGSQAATSIVIPKSVKRDQGQSIRKQEDYKSKASSKNKTYKMANNCIYRKINGTLTAVLVKTKRSQFHPK